MKKTHGMYNSTRFTSICCTLTFAVTGSSACMEEDADQPPRPASNEIAEGTRIDMADFMFPGAEEAFPGLSGETRTGYVASPEGIRKVQYEVIKGQAVIEGDIRMALENIYPRKEDVPQPNTKSTARTDSNAYWPNNTVPYRVAANFVDSDRVYDALRYWEAHTGLNFKYREDEANYIRFVNGEGCSSHVGMAGDGLQEIRLGTGCGMGNIVHEIGHAVGLWHEQSRADRDDYVNIHWSNIESGKEHNFRTYVEEDADGVDIGDYDYGSIMHYGSWAFSKNGNATITKKDGSTFNAQRTHFTNGDLGGVRHMYGFGNGSIWHSYFSPSGELPAVGDFNGDGIDDIVTFVHGSTDHRVWVALSTTTAFGTASVWKSDFCPAGAICRVGDVNNDGKDDIIAFLRNSVTDSTQGDVKVALSNGSGFGTTQTWHTSFCYGMEICDVGDFNGDGRTDIAAFVRSSRTGAAEGDVWVALSTGSSFGTASVWHSSFCYGNEQCAVGDMDGDGKADIIAFVRVGASQFTAPVWVAHSNGAGFYPSYVWSQGYCLDNASCQVGDVNGDGRGDLVIFTKGSANDVMVLQNDPVNSKWWRKYHDYFCLINEHCALGDFTGDGLDDIAAFTHGSAADVWVAR